MRYYTMFRFLLLSADVRVNSVGWILREDTKFKHPLVVPVGRVRTSGVPSPEEPTRTAFEGVDLC